MRNPSVHVMSRLAATYCDDSTHSTNAFVKPHREVLSAHKKMLEIHGYFQTLGTVRNTRTLGTGSAHYKDFTYKQLSDKIYIRYPDVILPPDATYSIATQQQNSAVCSRLLKNTKLGFEFLNDTISPTRRQMVGTQGPYLLPQTTSGSSARNLTMH